jgi:hypothetical protein
MGKDSKVFQTYPYAQVCVHPESPADPFRDGKPQDLYAVTFSSDSAEQLL